MVEQQPSSGAGGVPNGTIAGIVIGACAVCTIFAVAHHPTVAVRDPAAALAAIVRLGETDRIVHGALIAVQVAMLFGFAVFSARRGLHRASVVAAFCAYAVGVGAWIGAAVIDGFLAPDIAARFAGSANDGIVFAIRLLTFGGLAIQNLTKLGVVATACALVLWSAGLARGTGALRATGILGIVSAFASLAVLVAGPPTLTPVTLGLIVTTQGVWYLAIAAVLVRGRV